AGVVHAAGVVRDGPIHALDPDSFAATFGPKLDVAEALAALLPPDVVLVCVSSLAGVTGAPGQLVSAAANAGVDAVARRRVAAGGRAVSIAYGPWAGTGMARGRSWRQVAPLSVDQGLAALGAALAGREAVVVAAYVPAEPAVAPLPVDRAARLVAHATRVLGRPVDVDRPLVDQGLDSILAVQLRNRLLADGIDAPLHALTSGASLASLGPAAASPAPPAEPIPGSVWAAGFVGAAFGALLWALVSWLTGG
ncbi:MAG: beta-ketoacyl reductase, partial [Myxococcota bacterium]